MYPNETMLTPLFRYIIWSIEKDESECFECVRREIKTYNIIEQDEKRT